MTCELYADHSDSLLKIQIKRKLGKFKPTGASDDRYLNLSYRHSLSFMFHGLISVTPTFTNSIYTYLLTKVVIDRCFL